MYNNTKTGPELHRIGQFASENEEHLTVPPAALMDVLRLMMSNTVTNLGTHIGYRKWGLKWERHQHLLRPQSSSAYMRRQYSHSLETSSNSIVASSTTS